MENRTARLTDSRELPETEEAYWFETTWSDNTTSIISIPKS